MDPTPAPSGDRRITTLQVAGADPRLVLDAPAEQAPLLEALGDGAKLDITPQPGRRYPFLLAFVRTLSEVERVARLTADVLAGGDSKLWLAYPKGSSRRYTCEFNRDTGWAALGDAGFETVRQVAIDEDWSALRFRRVAFIGSMVRDPSRALTKEGRARGSAR
jgi:hypothetical protein